MFFSFWPVSEFELTKGHRFFFSELVTPGVECFFYVCVGCSKLRKEHQFFLVPTSRKIEVLRHLRR